MKLSKSVGTPRRKAVWGPTCTFAAAFAVLSFAFAPSAMAAGRHADSAKKANVDRPNGLVKSYKIDKELTDRARTQPNGTTRATARSPFRKPALRGSSLPLTTKSCAGVKRCW